MSEPQRSPNIVIIVVDSVRRDHLSCYGYERATTPAIDRIAANGTLFTDATTAAPWTLPSHASLFTGLYPSRHRADIDTQFLATEHPTLAQFLRGQGYETIAVTCNGFISHETGLDRGFDRVVDVTGGLHADAAFGRKPIEYIVSRLRRWRAVDRGAQKATNVAEKWLRRRRVNRPYFLFLNYMECHLPYRLKLPHRYCFIPPSLREVARAIHQDPFAMMAGRLKLNEEQLHLLISQYDGCLSYLDEHVDRIFQATNRSNARRKTIFVITSDHGENFGEHGLMDHQYSVHETLLRVPLIIYGPGFEAAVDDRPIQLVDLLPTIAAEVAPLEARQVEESWQGVDHRTQRRAAHLAEYLVPNTRAFQRRFPDLDLAPFQNQLRSVRQDSHKLIWRSDGAISLYDLNVDPAEREDLASTRPTIVERLFALMEKQLDPPPNAPPLNSASIEPELKLRLEELGYL